LSVYYCYIFNELLDVEAFLLKTLRDVELSNAACSEKDKILKKLKAIQDDYPQLRHADADLLSREREPTSATLRRSPRRPETEITCNDDIAGEQCYICLLLQHFCPHAATQDMIHAV